MIVVEMGEDAADHAVTKVARALERCDSTRQLLTDDEVASAPRDLVAERQKPRRPAGDSLLVSSRGRSDMGVDTASEIEAACRRRGNMKREFYSSHRDLLRPNANLIVGFINKRTL